MSAKAYFSLVRIFQSRDKHRWTESVASPSDSLEGAHAHAIPLLSHGPRGAGSAARFPVTICEGPKLKSNDPRKFNFAYKCVLNYAFYLTE